MHTGLLPVAAAFLDEPQAHDILERAEAALARALVGEVRVANGVCQDRLVRLHAEQRPCAAGAEREAARAGDGGDSRGRVVRADGGEMRLIEAQLLRQLRTERSAKASRAVERRKDLFRKPQRLDRLPVLRGGVIEHGGRRLGVFRLLFSRQEVAQQIRHEQKRLRRLQRRVALLLSAVELIDGVEVHRRNAGTGKERRKINGLPDGLHIRIDRVSIRTGIGEQVAVLVEQAVVHAPSVDADAVQFPDVRVFERQKALLQLAIQIRQIPVEHTVHFDIVVFKPVQLAHRDLLAIELAENGTPVACTEIKRQ